MPGPTVEKALNRLAKRCGLNRGAYERHVLEPAIRRSEKKHGLTDELSGIAERAMRAARTSRVRTDKGLIRWLENATWRYRQNRWARKLAEKQTPVQATATDRQASERAALEKAAKAREEERLAGIERRRVHARRTVLGLLATARTKTGAPLTAEWATEEWNRIQTWPQGKCWELLRPALGLKPGTFGELIRRKQESEAAIQKGLQEKPNQELALARRRWRAGRRTSWHRIGIHVLVNSRGGRTTDGKKVTASVRPEGPLPAGPGGQSSPR